MLNNYCFRVGRISSPMIFMALALSSAMGDPTTICDTPISLRSIIFSVQISLVPEIEKASIMSSVTAANAWGIFPCPSSSLILFTFSSEISCLSSTMAGVAATMKATTGAASFFASSIVSASEKLV